MKQGFILIYTVIIVGIVGILTGIAFNSIMAETRMSRDDTETLKAFYAADTGIECVRFYQHYFRAFDTMTPTAKYNCGIGSDFTAGLGTAECVAHEYNFTITGFSNGSCTAVTVKTTPRTIMVDGSPVVICDFRVFSNGKNSCSASGSKLVERVRWEDM